MVPRGVTHISCHYKNTIEGTGENRRTNEQTRTMLGVNSEQKESMQHYISVSIYGLTLVNGLLAKIPQSNWNADILTRSSSLDPIFSAGLTAPVSGLDCPCPWFHANCLSAPFSNQLSSRVPLPLPATPRFQVQKPFVWFRAKTDKGIVCLAGHLYSVTNICSVTDVVYSFLIKI